MTAALSYSWMALAGWRSLYNAARLFKVSARFRSRSGSSGAERRSCSCNSTARPIERGGAFRIARFILQQTQIAVGQGQVDEILAGTRPTHPRTSS